jgi:hypothetical protein
LNNVSNDGPNKTTPLQLLCCEFVNGLLQQRVWALFSHTYNTVQNFSEFSCPFGSRSDDVRRPTQHTSTPDQLNIQHIDDSNGRSIRPNDTSLPSYSEYSEAQL